MNKTYDSDQKFFIGSVGVGRVIELQRDEVIVLLSNTQETAVLHRRTLTQKHNIIQSFEILRIGDEVTGLLISHDLRRGVFTLDIGEFQRVKEREDQERPLDRYYWIEKVTLDGITVADEQGHVVGFISDPYQPWSRFAILQAADLLRQGQRLALVPGQFHFNDKLPRFDFPLHPPLYSANPWDVFEGEVVLVRPHTVRAREDRLRNLVYVHIGDGHIVRLEYNYVEDINEHLPVGKLVEVVIPSQDILETFNAYHKAEIRRITSRRKTPIGALLADGNAEVREESFLAGNVVSGRVIKSHAGASVLISDYVTAFMPGSTIGSVGVSAQSIIKVGDLVEGRVLKSEDDHSDLDTRLKIAFIKHIEQSSIALRPRETLIDTYAEKTHGSRGGYRRDAAFRMSVLEAYNNRCCCCGKKFSFLSKSPMEAAHIIPRANRGADVVQNSLCLCPMHHWSFDQGMWSIDQDLNIVVRKGTTPDVQNAETWLTAHSAAPAHLGNPIIPSIEALKWHMKNYFQP